MINEKQYNATLDHRLLSKDDGISQIKDDFNTASAITKEISPIVIKKSEYLYDDVTLKVIKKANNIAPNLTNKYLNNPTKITENINDSISSYLPGIPQNNKWGIRGFLTGYTIEKYIQYKINQEKVYK